MKKFDLVASHDSENSFRMVIKLVTHSCLVVTIQFADGSSHLRFLGQDVIEDITYIVTHIAFIVLSFLCQFRLVKNIMVTTGKEIFHVFIRIRYRDLLFVK